jgi:hypothetical protein
VEPALLDDEIMVTAAKPDAAHLYDPKAPTFAAIVYRRLLQQDDTVRNGMELQVVLLRRQIVKQNDRTLSAGKIVLQREHLPPVAQSTVGKQAQLRKTIDDDPLRVELGNPVHDQLRRLVQLHFRRMKDRQLAIGIERRFRRNKLEECDTVERPAVAFGDELQLALRLRQRDV